MIVVGTTLVRVGAIGAIVTVFIGNGIVDWTKSLGLPLPWPSRRIAVVTRFVLLACAAGGAWLMAAPDPSLGDELAPGAKRRKLFRAGIALAMALAAGRVVLGPWLPPLGAAAMSVAALLCTLQSVRGLGDVVRDLVARSETGDPDAAADAGRGGTWVYWAMGAVGLFGLLGSRRGPAAAALTIETSVIGIGVVGAGFALYSLVKSSRAIRDELARAPREPS